MKPTAHAPHIVAVYVEPHCYWARGKPIWDDWRQACGFESTSLRLRHRTRGKVLSRRGVLPCRRWRARHPDPARRPVGAGWALEPTGLGPTWVRQVDGVSNPEASVCERPLIGDQGQANGEEDQGADHEEAHAPLLQVRQLRFSLRPPLLPGSPRSGPPVH